MSKNVKLLLKESIRSVGRVGDIVDVSAGYARNYLLPQDLAVLPTPNNVKKVEERKKEIEKVERERREQQAALIGRLEGVELMLERRANELGHLYGAVSATEVAKGLQGMGYNIEPEDVNLPGKLDRINTYQVTIRFAEDLTAEIKVWVNPDADSKAGIEAHDKTKTQETATSPDEADEDARDRDVARRSVKLCPLTT
jgi:large subunit ribosomal protein L9